jgi:ABC-type dipeptide/oligopeptide/nickel transport system ATPase component
MRAQDLLSAELTVSYKQAPAVLRDMRIRIRPGEIVGLVGHSGSGKSSLASALMGLLECRGGTVSGSVLWNGSELLTQKERDWQLIRGKQIAFVPQSPVSSLNPALRLGVQFNEAWKLHRRGSRAEREDGIFGVLQDVGLPATHEFLKRYPAAVSVGQAQRFLIAMAVVHGPQLLIADEPTSALDAITQAEILALFAQLNRKLSMAILFISHDLLSVYSLCHRVALLHQGTIVECGTPQQIFFSPRHPFTQKLVAALPSVPTAQEVESALSF